jgi:hypothetical protein
MNKMLTSASLHGLLLDGRLLALDRGQLLFEGLLGPSSAYSDSRSKTKDQDLAKYGESAQDNVEDSPSAAAWRSAAASLAFRLTPGAPLPP